MAFNLSRQLFVEYLGSLVLTMTAISATILAYNVLSASLAITVLFDALAVGFILFFLIESFGFISGAHFNPAVTMAFVLSKDVPFRKGAFFILTQFIGGLSGVILSHIMFYGNNPVLFTVSDISRDGGCYLSEFVATFILIFGIMGLFHNKARGVGLPIGLLVGGFLISTASTMFANPMITFSRIFTYAIAGVAPSDAGFFILAQILGALSASAVSGWLFRGMPANGRDEIPQPPIHQGHPTP